jgi:hypothetical protein
LWLEHQEVMLTTDRDGGRLVIATVGNWSRWRPISNSHRGKLLGTVFFTCADSMVDQRASDLEMAFVTALRQGRHPGRRRWFFSCESRRRLRQQFELGGCLPRSKGT